MNFRKPTQSAPQRQSGGGLPDRLEPGLYVVATPIGNIRDITLRALDVLAAADVILAEDTRVAAKLLTLHGVKRPLSPLHDHNEAKLSEQVVRRVAAGEAIALISDAGTPLISDPGYKVVRAAAASGVKVIHVPGASSALAALVVSGLPPDRFFFCGFLPPKSAARRTALQQLRTVPGTLIFFEGPSRLAASLGDMAEVLGPRPAAIARELTKMFEECVRGPLDALAARYAADGPPKGEIVVVVAPPPDDAPVGTAGLDDALRQALAAMGPGQAASQVAAALGLPRKDVYARALFLNAKPEDDA